MTNPNAAGILNVGDGGPDGTTLGKDATDKISFHGATAVAKQTVTGSAGSNAALASLLTALETLGLITDSSS